MAKAMRQKKESRFRFIKQNNDFAPGWSLRAGYQPCNFTGWRRVYHQLKLPCKTKTRRNFEGAIQKKKKPAWLKKPAWPFLKPTFPLRASCLFLFYFCTTMTGKVPLFCDQLKTTIFIFIFWIFIESFRIQLHQKNSPT